MCMFELFGSKICDLILEWTTSLDSSSGSLLVRMCRCPSHVGRNYVPLFGVDTNNIMLTYVIT